MKKLLAALLSLLPLALQAAEYHQVDPKKSSVSFVSRQMGVPVGGSFAAFQASIRFDPEHPEAAAARVDIDIDSIDAGNPDADAEVRSPAWFDVGRFKTATFEAVRFKSAGVGQYEAVGKMTIKGVSQELLVPFRARVENDVAVLEGTFPISRKQYGLGSGDWLEIVGDEVGLTFLFTLAK